jgi:hypothetical protein
VRSRRRDAVLITDARLSLEDEQRIRKRTYAVLMVVHLVGLVLAGLLVHIWWLALGIVVLTGPLPWVAVVIANDRVSKATERRSQLRRSRRAIEQSGRDHEADE